MKTLEDTYRWIGSQVALSKDTLHYYEAPSLQYIPDTKDMTEYMKKRIDKLNQLEFIFNNYRQLEEEGLFGDVDLEMIEDLRNFCVEEKEIFKDRMYEHVQDKDQFFQTLQDNDSMTYFQDIEIWLRRLESIYG